MSDVVDATCFTAGRGSRRTPAVFVTGATGYIGGRLVPVLEASGVRLRCLARRPAALGGRVARRRRWSPGISSIPRHSIACSRVSTSPITSSTPWALAAITSKRIASPPAILARRRGGRGFGRVVYLGGLATSGEALSAHLESRLETGRSPERKWRAGRGIPRVRRDRVGQPLVRADPRARRAPAGHDLPALGVDTGAANRYRRRARVSGGGAGPA